MGMKNELDARGLFCPEPVFKTSIELQKMQSGEVLTVLTDDPMSEVDITDFCNKRGYELLNMEKTDIDFKFTIKKVK
tara:strand:+ start:1351 stop:1581 length:231 start_codon:yes stop_codon:yes gene_type:complete